MPHERPGPRVVVIGGGIIGACCLYSLASRGLASLDLVEKGSLCSGSSGRSVGMVETQYTSEVDILMRARSLPLFYQMEKEAGVPFFHNGYLRLARSPEVMERYRQSARLQRSLGLEAEVPDRDGVARLVPGLRVDDVLGGLFGPRDGYIDPVAFVNALVERARALGARVHLSTEVTGVRVQGGRVVAVETDRGTLPADYVVNAAGAWAPRIGEMVGLALPVAGYKRRVLVFQAPRDMRDLVFVMDFVPGTDREGVYFRGDATGLVLAGLHWEGFSPEEAPQDPDAFPQGVEWDFVERTARLLEERYPPAREFTYVRGWSGLYPITPDTEPILGEAPGVRGLINAVGFNGYGIQVAPVVGEVVAEIILEGQARSLPDLSPFRLERFL